MVAMKKRPAAGYWPGGPDNADLWHYSRYDWSDCPLANNCHPEKLYFCGTMAAHDASTCGHL